MRNPRRATARARDGDPKVQISKRLSHALRHGALELGLPWRGDGFVPLDAVLSLSGFRGIETEVIQEIVKIDRKNRYSLIEEDMEGSKRLWIRANQGHSIPVDTEKLLTLISEPADLPICIHATNERALPQILRSGLSRMSRIHIHFTTIQKVPGVERHMTRASACIDIYIDVEKAIKDGIRFYRSENNVILSAGIEDNGIIPKEYFLKIINTKTGEQLYPV